MMANEKAVLKVISNQTREYTALLHEHNTLLKVHKKAIDICALIESKRYDLRKDNKELRVLLKEAQAECRMLQESLDQAERELMEK